MSDTTFPNSTHVIEVLGQTFVERGGQFLRVGGEALAGAATAEAGGVVLATASLAIAAMPGVPVSREYAEQIGAAERAQRAEAIANAHGRPIALPTPSPFQNETFVRALPTQAAIDATTAPQPRAGNEPQVHAPGLAPPHPGTDAADNRLEARRYPYVASAATHDGAIALSKIEKCGPHFEQFKSVDALKRDMNAPQGWEVHHLVEQRQYARFGTEALQSTSNAIALPRDIHQAISTLNSSAPRLGEMGYGYAHLREFIETLPYEWQRQIGLTQVREAVASAKNLSPQDRASIDAQIKTLDHPGLCPAPPAPPQPQIPDLNDLQNAIDNHNQQSSRPLPDARSVANWDGSTRSGTFLDLGNGQVAQHQGAGAYAVADVQQQLGGVQPPIGQYATLQQNGQIEMPQQRQSLGMQLG